MLLGGRPRVPGGVECYFIAEQKARREPLVIYPLTGLEGLFDLRSIIIKCLTKFLLFFFFQRIFSNFFELRRVNSRVKKKKSRLYLTM